MQRGIRHDHQAAVRRREARRRARRRCEDLAEVLGRLSGELGPEQAARERSVAVAVAVARDLWHILAGDRPLPAPGAPLSAATLDALVEEVDAAVIDAAAGWEGSEALVLDLAGRLAAGVQALARHGAASVLGGRRPRHPRRGPADAG